MKTLSDKINDDWGEDNFYWLDIKDVKKAVKELKEKYENMFINGKLRDCMKTIGRDEFMQKIDKIFGDKLI